MIKRVTYGDMRKNIPYKEGQDGKNIEKGTD